MKRKCKECPKFIINPRWIKGMCGAFPGMYLNPEKPVCIIGMKEIRNKERELE